MSYKLMQGVLLLLAICFGLQVFSPLRLNTDAIVLLSMARSAAYGRGFLDSGQKTLFPPGYPALLAIMVKAGLAHSGIMILVNCILLAVGLRAAYFLFRDDFAAEKTNVLIWCSLFLMSYVVIKHFTIPLSDVPFFCCSMCCLFVVSRGAKAESPQQFLIYLIGAWILTIAAITLRTIGVALIPPLLVMIARSSHTMAFLRSAPRWVRVTMFGLAVFACIGTAGMIARISTVSGYMRVTKPTMFAVLPQTLSYRLTELGEVFVNAPSSKLPTALQGLLPWVGMVPLLLTLSGLAMKRRAVGSTEVYLICYMIILFLWPYRDARFWLPVIPLLIAYSSLSINTLRVPSAFLAAYCLGFALLGLVAIAYSTRISLAGPEFPDVYGDKSLRPTYCAAFQSCSSAGEPDKVDPKVLRLLREYN